MAPSGNTGPEQSIGEEVANALTHGIGAVLSVAGLVVLVVFASLYASALHIVSVAIYGTTLVLLYTASTVYHAVRGPRAKTITGLLDHAAIFLLIAGTYTPFSLISLGGASGWSLFFVVWTLAIVGVLFKLFHRRHGRRVSLPIYLAMGWLVIVVAGEVWGSVGASGTLWLLVGGIFYSVGTLFYAWDRLPYNHTVWHLFVLAGSVCHFVAVVPLVLPVT